MPCDAACRARLVQPFLTRQRHLGKSNFPGKSVRSSRRKILADNTAGKRGTGEWRVKDQDRLVCSDQTLAAMLARSINFLCRVAVVVEQAAPVRLP